MVVKEEKDLYQLPPGSIQKAQRIFRKAYKRLIRECELDARPDLWTVISLASISAVVAETAAQGQTLYTDDGVEKIVKWSADQFAMLLRQDLISLLEREAKQTKQ